MTTPQSVDVVASDTTKPRKSLLDLPAEIWSQIGKLAVDNESCFTLDDVKARYRNYQPSITRVCKVLRNELLPYYYNTKICMSTRSKCHHKQVAAMNTVSGRRVGRWLQQIGLENARNAHGLAIRGDETLTAEKVQRRWRFAVELGEPVWYECDASFYERMVEQQNWEYLVKFL